MGGYALRPAGLSRRWCADKLCPTLVERCVIGVRGLLEPLVERIGKGTMTAASFMLGSR